MTQSDNILAFNAKERRISLDAKLRRTVTDCRRVFERALPKLMGSLFDKLDDALYELADRSETNQLQTTYFDAMRVVRRQRERIQSEFVQGVLNDYDALWKNGPARNLETQESLPGDEDSSDLSLMENTELEQSLAVTNMVSKGENRYHRELFKLSQCFAGMLEVSDVDAANNPLGPRMICENFRQAMSGLSLGTQVLLVIYKMFDKQVMNYIGGLYDEANALLARAGIRPRKAAPGVGHGSGKGHVGAGGQSARDASDGGTGHAHRTYDHALGGREGLDPDATVFFDTLRELLASHRGHASVGLQMEELPRVDIAELMGALSQLQHGMAEPRPRPETGVHLIPDLRQELKQTLHLEQDGKRSRELGRQEDDAIDVIAMLFEFFLEDPNLPDAMKALIARLQIPLLKVSIMDKSFFSRSQHPARRLLNDLGRAAAGWSDDGDRSGNSLYGRIESVVERVVSGFEDDPAIFEELLDEFGNYMDRERRGAEIAEERTTQVSRGKEQLNVAKRCVGEEISRRLAEHRRLPLVARTILEDGWRDVLLLTYLRQGTESADWGRHLKTADNLLWSVQPKNEYHERQKLLRAIPELLQSLREGLNGISFDQHRMARMFKELQACHVACLRGAEGPQVLSHNQPLPQDARAMTAGTPLTGQSAGSSSLPGAPQDTRKDEFTQQAERLVVGDWLEVDEEDGRHSRLKLSWKSDVSDAYVFVNHRGIKVLETTMAGVAKLFRDGKARTLEQVDTPIMDRAMDAMLQTLKSA